MQIKPLNEVSLDEIVKCLSIAFENYFVPMPNDVAFWKKRFYAAQVDFSLSFGAFDEGKIVGFIMNGIGMDQGEITAYNAGTGVIPKARGQRLVDQMYEKAIPLLKSKNVQRCSLEVIDKNAAAIKVYERIGFKKKKRLKCFSGDLPNLDSTTIQLNEFKAIDLNKVNDNPHHYAWDNQNRAILKTQEDYHCFHVVGKNDLKRIGYFVVNRSKNYLAQIETLNGDWDSLFAAVQQVIPSIKINNIDESRMDLIEWLETKSVKNTIDQFEMELDLF